MEKTTQPQETTKTTSTKSTATQTPLPVKIIAWLMIIGGILVTLGSFAFILVSPLLGIIILIIGVGNIIVAIGVLRLRRWALYAYTILTALGIITYFIALSSGNGGSIISLVIQIAILVYLWSIQKLFK